MSRAATATAAPPPDRLARQMERRRTIRAALELADQAGPVRVMTAPDWCDTTEDAARKGIRPAVVLVRADGWTLGAPRHLVAEARALWAESWIAEAALTGAGWTTYSVRDVG